MKRKRPSRGTSHEAVVRGRLMRAYRRGTTPRRCRVNVYDMIRLSIELGLSPIESLFRPVALYMPFGEVRLRSDSRLAPGKTVIS